jgi:hypothetical protein
MFIIHCLHSLFTYFMNVYISHECLHVSWMFTCLMNVCMIEIVISDSNAFSHSMRKCLDVQWIIISSLTVLISSLNLSHECLHDWNRNFRLECFVSLDENMLRRAVNKHRITYNLDFESESTDSTALSQSIEKSHRITYNLRESIKTLISD